MTTSRISRGVAAALLMLLLSGGVHSQQPLKIFDSHLHYNDDATNGFITVDQVLDTFRRSGVGGIVANSRPNRGTHELVEAKAPGLWVVPFIRPYRTESDVKTWFNDPAIYQLIEDEYKRGYYRGIGEFHIYGRSAESPWVQKTVDFAVQHDLFVLAHGDDLAIAILFAHNPKAKIIWAHTGFSTDLARVRELLDRHPAHMAELSYRSGISAGDGRVSPEWREMFARYSDRFLLGSDTWVNQRWASYGTIMKDYRAWLADLPAEQARRIASGNAERIYGGKVE
jgi:hypothetical protein